MNHYNQRLKLERQKRTARLRRLHEEEKITQTELAKREGVSYQRIQQLLRGA